MISIQHVTKRFGRSTAVEDASLAIEQGDSLALWGANGAGKTTLIRCVLGLLRFQGAISVAGRDVWRDGKTARRLIGYVPQELGFYDELGVHEAILFFARLKGIRSVRPSEALASVGLAGHEHKRVRELSGGMKQRLALAIALLGDPPILVLDEVTASLDAVGRAEFVKLLETLSGSGRTMLFASHRIEEVASLSRRVAVLSAGRIERVLPVGEFVTRQSGDGAGAHTAVLHLTIAPSAREVAMHTLRSGGFSPQLNGVGVLVPVSAERKAAPFRVLADARVAIDDFEIVSLAHAAAMASDRKELGS